MSAIRCLLALLLCASIGLGADVRTLDGKKVSGSIVAVDAKDVTVATSAGNVKTPIAQVLDVVLAPVKPLASDTRRIDVELIDGSVFRCQEGGLVVKGTKVEVTLLSGQKLALSLKDVAHYLKDAQDPKIVEKWKAILKKKAKLDRAVVLREGKLNSLEGTLGEADENGERIAFKDSEGENLKLLFAKIHGLIFYRPEPAAAPTVCQVFDTGGNVLMAQKLTADGAGFTVTTVTGAEIKLDKLALARLDYNINKLNFLSELEPIKVVERSGSGLVNRYRRDRNLDDGAIQVDGKPYAKGLAMHAYTELEYNLDGKYKELRAIAGVDELVGGDSKATLTIECDDVKVFQEEIGRKTVKTINLKIKDVNKLRIIVSSKNVLDLHDHVTLADAKVTQ